MSFIRHLTSLQESYQTQVRDPVEKLVLCRIGHLKRPFVSGLYVSPQMSGLYSEILDRLDRAKRNLLEE